MLSPARAHRLRTQAAALAAAADSGAVRPDASGYELMLAKLTEDRRRLKTIESQQAKIELKRQLLPDYVPWVEGALTGNGAHDEVLTTVMVWRIDAGDWRGALDIAAYALRHRLALPDRFGRNLPCLIAEEFADQAQRGEPVPLDILLEAEALLADKDMPDQVRAKLCKAIGDAKWADIKGRAKPVADSVPALAAAQDYYQRAIRLHDKCGAKTDLQRVEKELKNLAKPADAGKG